MVRSSKLRAFRFDAGKSHYPRLGRRSACRVPVAECEGGNAGAGFHARTWSALPERDSRLTGAVQANEAQQRDIDSHARRVEPRPTSGREHSNALDDQP